MGTATPEIAFTLTIIAPAPPIVQNRPTTQAQPVVQAGAGHSRGYSRHHVIQRLQLSRTASVKVDTFIADIVTTATTSHSHGRRHHRRQYHRHDHDRDR